MIPTPETQLHRNNMEEGDCKLLKREKGTERQYRWLCRGCKLVLAYRSTDFKDSGGALYLKEVCGMMRMTRNRRIVLCFWLFHCV